MFEDHVLVWKFKRGNKETLCYIYEKYKEDLMTIAAGLLNERSAAEDIVHDVFVEFVRSVKDFQLTGSIRGYLATCVANRARSLNLVGNRRKSVSLDEASMTTSASKRPDQWAVFNEEFMRLNDALAELPYEQREAVMLHFHGKLTFKEISKLQDASIKTVESRYRYGLDKLRSILNCEVPNGTSR